MRIYLAQGFLSYLTIMLPMSFTIWISDPVMSMQNQQVLDPKQQTTPATTEELIAILRDTELQKREPERVTRAIRLLGERKTIVAIDDLIKLLTFKAPNPTEKYGYISGGLTNPYPSMTSLFEIGMPSVPPLIKVIENSENGSAANENAWQTIVLIFRDEVRKGILVVKEAAAISKTAEGKQRLLNVSVKMEKFVR